MASEPIDLSQQFMGLPMGELIGGPLNAAARAQEASALAQQKFLLFMAEEQNKAKQAEAEKQNEAKKNAENNGQ